MHPVPPIFPHELGGQMSLCLLAGSGLKPTFPGPTGFLPTAPFTCMIAMVVGVSHAPQPAVRFVDLRARVVAELSSRVGVALPSFYAFPPPWLVFIIRVILFVLDPEPLSFFHKRTFLIFT